MPGVVPRPSGDTIPSTLPERHMMRPVNPACPVWNPFRTGLSFEPWHGLCRQLGTGGLHCPDLTQRRQAIFILASTEFDRAGSSVGELYPCYGLLPSVGGKGR